MECSKEHTTLPRSTPRTYRVDDIAQILGIGRSSAYNLVKAGHFKTVRIGSSIRISRKSFDEWLENGCFDEPKEEQKWHP